MGLSSSKTKTTSTQNRTENATTTPVNPDWTTAPIQDLTTRIGGYGAQNPADQVAPQSPLQSRAIEMAGGLGGGFRGAPVNDQAYLQGGLGVEPGRSTSLPLPANGGVSVNPAGPGAMTTQGYGQSFDTAQQLALGGATAGPNYAGAAGYTSQPVDVFNWTAPQVGGGQIGDVQQASIPRLGGPAQANLPGIGDVASWQASLINPASIGMNGAGQAATVGYGPAGQAGPAQFGGAGTAASVTLDPAAQAARAQVAAAAQAGETNIDPVERIRSESLLDNLDAYRNPATNDIVNTTLSGFDDNTARARAAYAADAARRGAFGGSRVAFGEAALESDAARNRAAIEVQLRGDAFDRATALSASDRDVRMQASSTNAAAFNQRAQVQAQLEAARKMGNVQEVNRLSALQAEIDSQTNIENARFSNDRNLAQGRISADIGISNARNVTDRNIAEGRASADIGISNARNVTDRSIAQGSSDTEIGISNARNLTDYDIARSGIARDLAISNQDALNLSARDRAASENDFRARSFERGSDAALQYASDASQFMRDQFGRDSEAAQRYADTGNEFTRTQFLADQDMARLNAELATRERSENAAAANATANANANRRDAGLSFTAGAYNDNQRYNATARDLALNRRLTGANSIGSLASAYADAYRGDTALTAQLGDMQRGVDQEQRDAQLRQLQAMAQLYGNLNYGRFTGQTANSTMTGSGTQVTKSSPSVMDSIMSLGKRFARAYAMGG